MTNSTATAPQHVAVIGAGIGGLGAALALSRLGHQVTIVERDDTPMPEDVDAAFDWDRRGAPQVRHTHAFLARLTSILRDRYPDVLQALRDAGAREHSVGSLSDSASIPDVDDLTILACRRTTYEWVLRRAVLAEPNVSLRVGSGVASLQVDPIIPAGAAPRVTGVHLDNGDVVDSDVVVASTGRRGDVPGWLAGIGVEIGEKVHDTGIVYYSRFYRLNEGHKVPAGRSIGGRAGVNFVGGEADNDTFSITMAVAREDGELRQHLKDEERYERTIQLLRELAPLRQPGMSEPITPVHAMGGLINRLRRFTDDSGHPLATGFHAIGDAHTCTNPLYGRGCSLAMIQAALLADAFVAHPTDLVARAKAYESASVTEVEPWYRWSVRSDKVTLQRFGVTKPSGADQPAASAPGDRQLGALDPRIIAQATADPVLAGAFVRMMNLMTTPDQLFGDPDMMARMAAVAAKAAEERANRAKTPRREPQLTREDLLREAA